MIKIALRHQVFIDRIKRILCWDSFICFIAILVLLHAHPGMLTRMNIHAAPGFSHLYEEISLA